MQGTVVIRKVWDGRAQLEEIEADGASGHFEGLTLFLYNPEARQWSQTFSNSKEGTVSQPAIGEFRNGRGEFYDQEPYNGRTILVRVRLVRHHPGIAPLRAILFRRRRQILGTQLRRHADASQIMSGKILVRDVQQGDFAEWKPLWDGYNAFYGREGVTALPEEITNLTWSRFFDGYEPICAMVAERAWNN